MRFIKNNIKFLIAMILVIALGVFGITYAIKIAAFNPIVLNTTTGNITANITYDSTNTSSVTSSNEMLPIDDSLVTGVNVTDSRVLKIKFMVTGNSSNPDNSIYDISLRDIDMDNALKNEYVKWRLYKNGSLLSSGNFSPSFDIKENNRMVLTNIQQDLTTSTDTYVYLMWISESCSDSLSNCDISNSQDRLLGKKFNASIKIEASTKSKKELVRKSISESSASSMIVNMFTPDSLVENNSIKYRYDTNNSLMEDIDGNIRYYGASPNNYIYFNCSDYSNQSDSTCETWRIIGVFDGKVKIMRNEVIGEYSWDSSDSGTNSGLGVNEWSDADLMKLLNNGYDSLSVGGSLYWNSKSGTCYNGSKNATTSCDFTSAGLKNDTTRNLIAETTYSLGGWNDLEICSNQIYGYERGTTVYSGRSVTWTGKVAIPYPSDYGYATDLSLCNQTLSNYGNSTCTANNWMKSIITNNGSIFGWLLTPTPGYARNAWRVFSDGFVGNKYAYSAHGVAPVLFINANQEIESGSGTSSNPYKLKV